MSQPAGWRHLPTVALLLMLGACMPAGAHPGDVVYGVPSRPDIPEGQRPSPGPCRVWYPDRPPGHQPPPGPCETLQYQVPPGAFLVQG